MLKPKYGPINEKICIVTTHLIFSPKRGDVKLAQLQKLLANIDRIAFKRIKLVNNEVKLVYYPVILCGDMNFTLNSTIYKFLTESKLTNYEQHPRNTVSGQLKHNTSFSNTINRPLIPEEMEINDYSMYNSELYKRVDEYKAENNCEVEKLNGYLAHGTENLYHTFKFKSSYDLACFNHSSENDVTTCLPKNHEKVDFIFFHSEKEDDSEDEEKVYTNDDYDGDSYLELISVLKLYNKNDVENLYFPSRHIPSDHFLLSSKFSLLYK
jgi:protein angel